MIKLKPETYNKLDKRGKRHESFDAIISKLLIKPSKPTKPKAQSKPIKLKKTR